MRTIEFFDGQSSSTTPSIFHTEAGKLAKYADDAAYVADKGSVATEGDFYFNTTSKLVRYFDGSKWYQNEAELNKADTSDPTVNDDEDDGYVVLSLWLNTSTGDLFRCTDATAGSAVWVKLASDTGLASHMTDTTTHGTTGDIVGTSDTQTLTNKTLTSSSITTPSRLDVKQDTYSNLSTYASSASNGQLCFATDEKKMYQVVDSALTEVGGGGAGDADTIHLINVDDLKLSNIDLTGNNSSFDGGGTITASSLSLSTTAADLLTGDTVIKYLPAADGSNDYFGFTKSIPIGQRGTELGFQFNYKTTDDTEDEDFRFCVKIKDGANAGNISYYNIDEFYDSNNIGTVFRINSFIPKDCTEIEFGWQNTDTTTTVGLYLSNILVSQNYLYGNLVNMTEWESFTPTSNWTTNVTHSGYWRRVGDSMEVIGAIDFTGAPDSVQLTIDLPNGYSIDTNKTIIDTADSGGAVGIAGYFDNGTGRTTAGQRVFYVDSNSVRIRNGNTAYSQTVPITWASGDKLSYSYKVPIANWSATTENLCTPMTGPKQYSEANGDFTVTGTNWTTSNAVAMYYVGANGEHRLKFNISGALSSASTTITDIAISGATWAIGSEQAISISQADSNSISTTVARARNTSVLYAAFSSSVSSILLSGDIELDSKPTWADPVSSRYLAAVPSTRYQTKLLSANVTSDGVISDLTFNNLTIGKHYKISGVLRFYLNRSSDVAIDLTATNSTTVFYAQQFNSTSSGEYINPVFVNTIFKAAATSLTFSIASASSDGRLEGDNSRSKTYIQLEELPHHTETTEW